jgi:hypothetical protein
MMYYIREMTKKLELLMSKLECAVVDYKDAELEGTEAEYVAAEARLEEARMQLMQGFGEVPAGWKIVPAKPSSEDLAIGVRAMRLFVTKASIADFRNGYMAMLEAAPKDLPC